jgi:solute:Na+ symporter, SSS family
MRGRQSHRLHWRRVYWRRVLENRRVLNLAISPLDAVLVVVYLVGVALFGIWLSGKQDSVSEYVLGDRDLPWWSVLLSIVATETSTVTFLSVPGIAYAVGGNLTYLQLSFGYILARYLVAYFLLPLYFEGELFTAYQVLGQRFGGATKQAASALFLVTRSLADGLRLYLTALVLQEMMGLSLNTALIAMGALTVFYTFVGGVKAVVWTDCIQFAIYIIGAIAAGVVLLLALPGGATEWLEFARANNKLQLFRGVTDFNPAVDFAKPFTFWAGLIGGTFIALGSHGTDQLMVQRYLCARNLRDARRALIASGWVVFAQFLLFLLLGIGLAAYFTAFPADPPIRENDRAFVRFIMTRLPVGLVGLTLAAVFSAAMSTLSGSLNSSATAAVNDFYRPLLRPTADGRELLIVSRWLTIFFGVVQIAVGMMGPLLGGTTVVEGVLTVASFTTGIVLGIFFLGVLTRRASQQAALVAILGGLAGMVLLRFGAYIPALAQTRGLGDALHFGAKLAFPWLAVVGSLGTFLLGLFVSVFWPALKPGSSTHIVR